MKLNNNGKYVIIWVREGNILIKLNIIINNYCIELILNNYKFEFLFILF